MAYREKTSAPYVPETPIRKPVTPDGNGRLTPSPTEEAEKTITQPAPTTEEQPEEQSIEAESSPGEQALSEYQEFIRSLNTTIAEVQEGIDDKNTRINEALDQARLADDPAEAEKLLQTARSTAGQINPLASSVRKNLTGLERTLLPQLSGNPPLTEQYNAFIRETGVDNNALSDLESYAKNLLQDLQARIKDVEAELKAKIPDAPKRAEKAVKPETNKPAASQVERYEQPQELKALRQKAEQVVAETGGYVMATGNSVLVVNPTPTKTGQSGFKITFAQAVTGKPAHAQDTFYLESSLPADIRAKLVAAGAIQAAPASSPRQNRPRRRERR